MEKKEGSDITLENPEKNSEFLKSVQKNSGNNSSNFKSLYVGDLSPKVDEQSLFRIFSKVSQVESIKIFHKIPKDEFLSYCYIDFKSVDDANRAFEILNFYCDSKIFLKPIRIMWNNPDDSLRKSGDGNLFVKNLPKNFGSKALFELFSPFGKISSCKMASDEDGNSLGYGFVHFEWPLNGKEAIVSLNGSIVEKKKIFVGPFLRKEDRGETAKPRFTNVYVKNLDIDKCTNERIMDIFGVFGEITSIFIPKKEEEPLGFVFVNFFFPEDAEEAIFNMNNKKIGNSSLYVGKAEKKLERERNLKKNPPKKSLKKKKIFLKKRFVIRNIPRFIKKGQILESLSNLGPISYLKLLIKTKDRLNKIVFFSFKKPKSVKNNTEPNEFTVNSKFFLIEIWEKTILKLKKGKKLFLKKKVEKKTESEKSKKSLESLKKKSKEIICKRKKILFSILKNLSAKKKKETLDLLLFLFIKKMREVNKKTPNTHHFLNPTKKFLHLFFCRKKSEKEREI